MTVDVFVRRASDGRVAHLMKCDFDFENPPRDEGVGVNRHRRVLVSIGAFLDTTSFSRGGTSSSRGAGSSRQSLLKADVDKVVCAHLEFGALNDDVHVSKEPLSR